MKARQPSPFIDTMNHMQDIPKMRREKERLEKDIKTLEAAKVNLEKQASDCVEYLDRFGCATRQAVYQKQVIDEQRKSLSALENYFIDEPAIVPEHRQAWKELAKDLWAEFKRVEQWLSASDQQRGMK